MKLTKSKLKQLIKEEMHNLLNEKPPVEAPHVQMHRDLTAQRRYELFQRLKKARARAEQLGIRKEQIPIGLDRKALLTLEEIKALKEGDPKRFIEEWNRVKDVCKPARSTPGTTTQCERWKERERKLAAMAATDDTEARPGEAASRQPNRGTAAVPPTRENP